MSQDNGRGSGYRLTVAIATGAALVLGGFTCTTDDQRRDQFANTYWVHRGEIRRVERELRRIAFVAEVEAETSARSRGLLHRMRKLQGWLDGADPPRQLIHATENLWWGLDDAASEFPCCSAGLDREFTGEAAQEISNARQDIDDVVGLR